MNSSIQNDTKLLFYLEDNCNILLYSIKSSLTNLFIANHLLENSLPLKERFTFHLIKLEIFLEFSNCFDSIIHLGVTENQLYE